MCEIKKGDRVRVTEIDEVCGFYFPDMHNTVGMVGVVIDGNGDGDGDGVVVDFGDGQRLYHYISSSVELVKEGDDD